MDKKPEDMSREELELRVMHGTIVDIFKQLETRPLPRELWADKSFGIKEVEYYPYKGDGMFLITFDKPLPSPMQTKVKLIESDAGEIQDSTILASLVIHGEE
jgi:hypothetical protein